MNSVYVIYSSSVVDNPSIEAVILVNNNIKVLNDLFEGYGDRVRQVHYHGSLENIASLNSGFKGLVKVFPGTKEEIIRYSGELKKRRCLVCPGFALEKVEDISLISSMGITVDLLYRCDQLPRDTVLKFLEFYLFYRTLEVPVEPFHTILLSMLNKTKLQLWNLFMMLPHRFFHIDESGIAFSGEKMRQGSYLFRIDGPEGEWVKTDQENLLEKYFKNIPQEQPGCMSCAHFHICFSWARYDKETCEMWKAVFERLQAAVREIEAFKKAKPGKG